MEHETEQFFFCPYCAQRISMLLEDSYGAQSYIEDCEVCCNPIQISYQIDEGQVISVQAERAQ